MKELKLKNNGSWYDFLISDIKTLAFEGIVKTKHAIGKRILEDELKFGKPEYGRKQIETLADDLNIGIRDLYRCIQFAKKYPELPESVTRDKIPWRVIVNEYLPEYKNQNSPIFDMETLVFACHKIIPKIDNVSDAFEIINDLKKLAQTYGEFLLEAEEKIGELLIKKADR